jgi:LytS/YehU family sensor histidine kinase
MLLWPSIWWYSWALLATGIYHLSERYPITRDNWHLPLLLHVLGCSAAYFLHVAIQIAAMFLPAFTSVHNSWSDAIVHHLITSSGLNPLIYWTIVGMSHAFIFYTRYRQRELQSARLEAELNRAQLAALKMQLQPHFLFNTLHAISALMYRDIQAADRIVAKLGDLLRQTIYAGGVNEVRLSEEISFLQKYLEIEQARFEDRLTVVFDIAPDTEGALVPNLLLQPLVENAIKHGISHLSAAGRIEVRAWNEADALHITIADNGPGLPSGDGVFRQGTGLTNTLDRLARLYPDRHAIDFVVNVPQGMIVSLNLPIKLSRVETHNGIEA